MGNRKWSNPGWIAGTFKLIISVLILLTAIMVLTNSTQTGYSPTSEKCISCHNYSTDGINGDGGFAQYKRPHNNNVMCESCHMINPHQPAFIHDGNY